MDTILKILIYAPPVLISIVLHEVAHGYAAHLLGDDTAKSQGRLTLNPIKHIDPVGTVILPLILIILKTGVIFGWAKPVPVNIYNTRNPKQALGLTALAGPMTNLALALLAILLLRIFGLREELLDHLIFQKSAGFFTQMLLGLLIINVVLMTFNLIPIPPLDGSRVLTWLLPDKQARMLMKLERYGMFIIFGIIILFPGLIFKPIGMIILLFLQIL